MTHPTDETLNDYVERELSPADHVRVATHLETCADCALVVAEIQQILRESSTLGPLEPPPHIWTLLEGRLSERRAESPEPKVQSPEPRAESPEPRAQSPEPSAQRQEPSAQRPWPTFVWALATAALVVLAFVTGRFVYQPDHQSVPRQAATTARPANIDQADVRERVLLIAVGDHLERSQMVLVELAHAETHGQLDISAERQLADDLVASNRLYRQTAQDMGQANVATLLDELERVLVEVARGPSTVSMRQLADIQQRIESRGILFKVKVIGSEIRNPPVS
jgi:anti-sigma factor RsiW